MYIFGGQIESEGPGMASLHGLDKFWGYLKKHAPQIFNGLGIYIKEYISITWVYEYIKPLKFGLFDLRWGFIEKVIAWVVLNKVWLMFWLFSANL